MTDHLRWGILGASSFALGYMVPAIQAARGSHLVALATRSRDKAGDFISVAGDLRIHDSYESLLTDPGVDAVYVPLPNHLHVEWTLKALAAGKHVLCEKPIAMREGEFADLVDARDASGKLAAEGFMIVHHPQWQKARALLQGGAIGELVHVDARFTYDNGSRPENIRNQTGMGGGGLRDIGVYIFGGVRYATAAEPLELDAQLRMQEDFDTFAAISAQFPGFSYSGLVSMRMFPRQEVVFHGREGVLRLTCPFNAGVFDQAEVELETGGLERRLWRFPGINHYKLQVEAFAQSALTGSAYPCPLEFSRGSQRMIDMALEAGART